NTLKINTDELYPKIKFDKINEYFTKYSAPATDENINQDYVFVLKRYNDKLSFLNSDIKKMEEERNKIESEKLDDKSLERLEEIENRIEYLNRKKKYFTDLRSLIYLPENKTKVVLDSEPISINCGMFKNEREEYDKIIDQKKFCEKNLASIKNEIEQLKKNQHPSAAAKMEKKIEAINQINKTLAELKEKIIPFETIKNHSGRRIVGVDGVVVEGAKLFIDGLERVIDKKYERIAFAGSFDNIVMEGFTKPDIEKIIYSDNSDYENFGQSEIFENLKLRKNVLFEGFDGQQLYQYAIKFLGIPVQNALFIDVDRYMFQSRKILRLNAILIGKSEDKNVLRQMFFKIKNSYPIQIVGASIKECMLKGIEHFQCSEDDLDYEILQHPNKSFLSIKKQTYVVKIFKRGKDRKDLD
ncbi:MAG TPA: Jag N-terminal domain-containing protein, partial [bacterium]|nr:Jag N-terminal domain-containing protein [bacterium]